MLPYPGSGLLALNPAYVIAALNSHQAAVRRLGSSQVPKLLQQELNKGEEEALVSALTKSIQVSLPNFKNFFKRPGILRRKQRDQTLDEGLCVIQERMAFARDNPSQA